MTRVGFPGRALPVLRQGHVAVVGGSIAGMAAALELVQAGQHAVLIEPRTYMGREITATLRPWLDSNIPIEANVIQGLSEHARGKTIAPDSQEIPLHPDKIKLYLEDILLAAGVSFLYASLPVGIVREQGALKGLIIGNKSGRQLIACETIVDATETAVAARVAGVEFESEHTGTFHWRRTLEFDQVKSAPPTLEVPPELDIVGNRVLVHQGYAEGDILVECEYAFTTTETGLCALNAREIEARHRSIRLASYLIQNVPAFARARFGTASNEMLGVYTGRLAGQPGAAWGSVEFRSGADRVSVPLSAFCAANGVWCLNSAARLDAEYSNLFLDPIEANLIGRALAQALGSTAAAVSDSKPAKAREQDAPDANVLVVYEQASPQRGRPYPVQDVPPQEIPLWTNTQVLVAGGGTSGATAARVAAEQGARTLLVELNPGLGGTATYGGVDAYWAGRHIAFAAQVKTRVNQIHAALNMAPKNQWNHQAKMEGLLQLADEANVDMLFNVITIGALVEQQSVRGVVLATRLGPYAVLADCVVDATGDADVAAFAGAEFVYGSARDRVVMWFSLNQQKRPGRTQGNFTSMVDVSNIEDYTRAILVGRRRGGDLYDHGIYVATRESRHIIGDATVTLSDILLQRARPDVINIHFSNFDIKGKSEADWELLGIVPPNIDVEIPYGALLPRGVDDLLVAGKAFSATHDSIPGTRMQADIENLGGVAGLAAALAVRANVTPRQLDIRELQSRLIQIGLLPAQVLTRELEPFEYTDPILWALIEAINPGRPLHAYSDEKLTEVFRGILPEVELGTAGARAIPVLERAHGAAKGMLKLRLAQLLCFVGAESGVPTLISHLEQELHAREELPPRESFIRNSNLPPPDQAAMPDLVYLLYTLGMARDKRSLRVLEQVADLLAFTEKDLWDFYSAPFLYVDAVCSVAERLGDPAAIPILEKIHFHPLLHDQMRRRGIQPDFVQERLAMLELALARAMARCGSPRGYVLLINYLNDNRALYAEQAHVELMAITGKDYGKDPMAWSNWLEDRVDDLEPCPVTERLDMPELGEIILRPSDYWQRLETPWLILPHPDFGKQMMPQYD